MKRILNQRRAVSAIRASDGEVFYDHEIEVDAPYLNPVSWHGGRGRFQKVVRDLLGRVVGATVRSDAAAKHLHRLPSLLVLEEPDAVILHVRICGSPG